MRGRKSERWKERWDQDCRWRWKEGSAWVSFVSSLVRLASRPKIERDVEKSKRFNVCRQGTQEKVWEDAMVERKSFLCLQSNIVRGQQFRGWWWCSCKREGSTMKEGKIKFIQREELVQHFSHHVKLCLITLFVCWLEHLSFSFVFAFFRRCFWFHHTRKEAREKI